MVTLNKHEFRNLPKDEIILKLKNVLPQSSSSEIESWSDTVDGLRRITSKITCDFIVVLEYGLPFSAKRIDALVIYNTDNGPHMDIFEFKQWSNQNVQGMDGFYIQLDFDKESRIHPFYQVNQYLDMLRYSFHNFDEIFYSTSIIVFMPNYDFKKDILLTNIGKEYVKENPIIIDKNNESLYQLLLKDDLSHKSIDNPLQNLIFSNDPELINRIFKYNNFQLYGGEEDVAISVIDKINNGSDVIINGYAGSGKTAIGLYILNRALNKLESQWNYIYASANEIRSYFISKFSDGRQNLFKVFGQVINNIQDKTIILLDEAHRMYTDQVDKLLFKVRNKDIRIIWMMDNYQSFSINEDNYTHTLIEKYKQQSRKVTKFSLDDTQFRYGDKKNYIPTVLSMFTRQPINNNFSNIIISNSIDESLNWYKSAGLKKGIIASDSWTGGRIYIDGKNFNSIKEFGIWSNLDEANNPASAYKCQGNSKENILFLWGEEFVYRNKKGWTIQPAFVKEKKWDSYTNRFDRLTSKEHDYIMQKFCNLYYVLMTRFNETMNIYCVDVETRAFLKTIFNAGVD